MGRYFTGILVCCLCWMTSSLARAELLPADVPIEQAVDHYVQARLDAEQVQPVSQISDAEFIRRVTLDLAGRIPTVAEAQAYVADPASDKRVKLVDRLLASPDYALHQRNELELWLMGTRNDGGFREYLLEAAKENRPWDQMFQEMFLTQETNTERKSALGFIKSRVRDIDDLTNDTSKLFFGISINCAKCHDHPLVLDWRQDHYYGMYSFFQRTYMNKRDQLVERREGQVKFKTTEGEDKQAQLMFLTGTVIEEPALPMLSDEDRKAQEKARREDDDKKEGPPPPPPEFSARQRLVELALRAEENRFFTRNVINRLWARMLGRGLVMPLDQMHSENPPSHPELLDWLARDTVEHHYDMKRLLRGIALSATYSRGSRWDRDGEAPHERLFAVLSPKALSPKQYALSLILASRSPDQFPADMSAEDWNKHRYNFENHSQHLANQIEIPGDNFQVSVSEALLFSNDKYIQNDLLSEGGDRLVGKLKTLPDAPAQLTLAFWSTMTRDPDVEEAEVLTQYLSGRSDRSTAALQQMVWVLLTSSELRFNH